jgi:methionine aminopeptidase
MEPTEQDDYDATFLDKPVILDRYKAAAGVTNAAMELAIKKCVAGADVHEVCMAVDAFITEELTKIFNNKKSKNLERGVAFPCCLSINEVAGHYSPMKEDSTALKDGDLVSIDLGAQMDGYASLAA